MRVGVVVPSERIFYQCLLVVSGTETSPASTSSPLSLHQRAPPPTSSRHQVRRPLLLGKKSGTHLSRFVIVVVIVYFRAADLRRN